MSLPEDPAMSESLHSSNPFVLSQPHSAWTKNCYEAIRKLGGGLLQKGKLMGRKAPQIKQAVDLKEEEINPKQENLDSYDSF